MDNGYVTLNINDVVRITRLASREHARRQKRTRKPGGLLPHEWQTELQMDQALLDRLERAVREGLTATDPARQETDR